MVQWIALQLPAPHRLLHTSQFKVTRSGGGFHAPFGATLRFKIGVFLGGWGHFHAYLSSYSASCASLIALASRTSAGTWRCGGGGEGGGLPSPVPSLLDDLWLLDEGPSKHTISSSAVRESRAEGLSRSNLVWGFQGLGSSSAVRGSRAEGLSRSNLV
jgi:hypothetical protein